MTSTAPSNDSLTPTTDETKSNLTDGFNSTMLITAYSHAMLNIVINPASSPPPAWFDTFNANLKTAQQHAQNWVDNLGPQISSTVPQTIIDYGNTFSAATGDILNILQTSNDNPNADQEKQILALVEALLTQLGAQKKTILDLQTQLQAFASNIIQDNANMQDGQNSAENAIQADKETIQKIKDHISRLQVDMAKANAKATVSDIGIGVGIFVAIAGFALAVATGGAALPLVVGAVAVVGVGGAIASSVIFNDQASKDLEQINSLQGQLSDENKQVAALQSIVSSITSLVTENEAAQKAMTSVLTMWDTLEGKLQTVLKDLNTAEKDTPGILQQLDIQTSQKAWQQLVGFATNMQDAASGLTIQPLITQKSAAS